MAKKSEMTNLVPKKKSKGKTVVKVIVAIAAVQGIMKLISMYQEKKSEKKTEVPETKEYSLWMNGKQVRFEEDEEIRSIHVKAVMSGLDLDLSHLKLTDDIFISGKAVMSGVCIRVPENVQVKVNSKSVAGAIANTVPQYVDESLPIIFIEIDGVMSGIAVKLGKALDEEAKETVKEDVWTFGEEEEATAE